ncbi:hypothetical protein RchiOBHm_Chr7g0206471 [Rosa chinensis]|uniref:Uncharacterized protein n=1 Tax=Rosa chinensis TaxID=74649 RepID=A0A2P6P968_ROSCH|nr:hypothetical protein RchiOBHm_Chr7g0206471 [Rosa chinensis]
MSFMCCCWRRRPLFWPGFSDKRVSSFGFPVVLGMVKSSLLKHEGSGLLCYTFQITFLI